MRWVPDRTGRLRERPHYEPEELDRDCEDLVVAFLREQHGHVTFPVSTDDLTVLLERYTDDLDLFADLSGEGDDVQGVTDFVPGQRPRVRISRSLSTDPRRENRLRTTLTHELGHVKFHLFLGTLSASQLSLFDAQARAETAWRCKRETILKAPQTDWMEWQAGYACGAFLAPVTFVHGVARDLANEAGILAPATVGSMIGDELMRRVQATFAISGEAARVRLQKLGLLSEGPQAPSIFGA